MGVVRFGTIAAALLNFLSMHFEFFHLRDQIKFTLARIYSRGMATISDGNISVWVSPCQVDKGKFKCGKMTKFAFSGEVAIERHR